MGNDYAMGNECVKMAEMKEKCIRLAGYERLK